MFGTQTPHGDFVELVRTAKTSGIRTNLKVQEGISRTLGFWLELGVSGFHSRCPPITVRRRRRPGSSRAFDPLAL
jgi:hypothetical protein